ncbi:AfsR/SARP family transcriptional regulator [Nocardioides mesophilus]|uniref:AAA family ATPase n=1 Tax=Nocardioides mesophilus TaxID=433659 RepID=A0A7G9R877_9ACTN|nr:AfsR/SARP family transcriptional regulator [Nocardioides mesophilus]QNN51802.1 AAA family ATPase [Nocardioides mesophilus]
MEWRVLGPLEVRAATGPADLGGAKPRAVLALLLAAGGRTVSVDRLVDEVWGEEPPPKVMASLQSYVAHLRRALERDRPARSPATLLVTRPPGYALLAAPDDVDAVVFERRAAAGHALLAGDPDAAAAELEAALGLWRGEAYADCPAAPSIAAEASRLGELRLLATEDRWQAEIDRGRHAVAVAPLEALVSARPLRERAWGLLALALYRCQRQGEALKALARARAVLVEELGLDPSPPLRDLEAALLRQDPSVAVPAGVKPAARPTARPPALPAPVRVPTEPPQAPRGLVGRVTPLATVTGALVEAVDGRGRLVLVTGEPGIGKTRLAQAAAAPATALGLASRWGRCDEGGTAPALWPWTQVLPGLVEEGLETFDLAERALAMLREAGPLLVVLDDLHWADADSLRLLRHLGPALSGLPVVVLTTLRDAEADWGPAVADALGDLARDEPLRLPLTGLTTDEVSTYVEERLHTGVPPDVARALRDRTEGNPFYIAQLVDLLAREHRLSEASAVAELEVPDGVRDVVRRRLAQLPDSARALLATAAVVGRSFDADVVEVAGDLDDPAMVDEGLEAALLSGLVTEEPSGSYRFVHALVQEAVYAAIPGPRRARRHAAVADTLAALRPDAERSHAAEIAEHHARAGADHARATWEWAARAAAQARRRAAPEEAARWLGLAVDAADRDRTATSADRHGLVVAHVSALIRAGQVAEAWERAVVRAQEVLDLGDVVASAELAVSVTTTVWNWRTYGSVDSRAVTLLERLHDELPAELSGLRARVVATLALELYWVDAPRSRELTAAALALAPADQPDRSEVSDVLEVAHASLMHVDCAHERLDVAERLLGRARAGGDRELEARALLMRGSDRLALGRFADGWSDYAAARELARDQGQPIVDVIVRYAEVLRPLAEGRPADAEQMLAEVVALHRRTTIVSADVLEPLFQLNADLVYGGPARWARAEQLVDLMPPGPLDELRALVLQRTGRAAEVPALLGVWADQRPLDDDFLWLYTTAYRAEVWAGLGDPVAAAALREQLLPYRGLPVWVGTGIGLAGFTDHYLGLLARALGELDEAVAELETARNRAAAEGMTAFEVLITHELARTRARRGRPGDAAEGARLAAEAATRASGIGLVLPR